jgi:predicted porin
MKVLNKLLAATLAALPMATLGQASEPAKPADAQPAAPPAAPAAEPAAAPAAKAAAAPAKPTVTVYGTLNGNIQTSMARGATDASKSVSARNAVSIDSSNIGVRGAADLLYGLKAVAQCETSAAIDGIGTSGICGRNSRVGLSGEWGTLFYGVWDTPFKAAAIGTKADDPFMNTDVFGFQSIMGSPGFGYRSSGWVVSTPDDKSFAGTTGFDVRAANSVGYHSPKIAGITAKVQYSADEFKSASGNVNPELFGVVVNYDEGPLSVLAAYEQHDDGYALAGINAPKAPAAATPDLTGTEFKAPLGNLVAAGSSKDIAWRVGAGYELATPAGATTVGVLFDELRLKQEHALAGMVKEYKRQAWQVSLKHRFGNHEGRVRYSQALKGDCTIAGGDCSADGYGAQMIAVGYAYHLAKSTQAYLSFMTIKNDENARYAPTIGGSPKVVAPAKGADPQALALGMRFSF